MTKWWSALAWRVFVFGWRYDRAGFVAGACRTGVLSAPPMSRLRGHLAIGAVCSEARCAAGFEVGIPIPHRRLFCGGLAFYSHTLTKMMQALTAAVPSSHWRMAALETWRARRLLAKFAKPMEASP